MMNEIIPSFRSSIFGDLANFSDLAELGIDSILNDGLLKDIPIVGTLLGITKIGQNLHDRNLLRQTLQFIYDFNNGDIDREKLNDYKERIESDGKKAEQELGRVLLILNSTLEQQKATLLANLFRSYVNGKIDWSEFCEFSEIVRMLFLGDLAFLAAIYSGKTNSTTNLKLYPFGRLSSLGLITTSVKTVGGGTRMRTDDYVYLSELGGKFFGESMNTELRALYKL